MGASLSKEKVILVALPLSGGDLIEKVSGPLPASELPNKTKLMLWHAGKQKEDKVDDGVFKYPAFDVGGLTNCRQTLGGEPPKFEGAAHVVDPQNDLQALSAALHEEWGTLLEKVLPEEVRDNLFKFLVSVRKEVPDGATLRFHRLKAEHRVVVTPADVKELTGHYYDRRFGSEVHAVESDGDGLYCAVADEYVTSNINQKNLAIEYTRYTELN